jgi:chromosome segregation ATPase
MPEKEVDCDELSEKMNEAQWAARDALNEQFEAYDSMEHEADDIREAHDFFDEKNMTDEEIVEAQIDLIETARQETADDIKEVNEEMKDDWSDAHGAGADDGLRDKLDSLEDQMEKLDEVEERLAEAVDDFKEARDDYDEASAEAAEALDNWDEHCAPDPPEEPEEEPDEPKPPRPRDEEDEEGGFGGEDPNP